MTDKYKVIVHNSIQTSLTYRFQFFSGMFILIVPFFIRICLWKLAYASNGTGEIQDYTYSEMFAYNVSAMLFAYLNTTYFQYETAGEIKDGSLSRYLVKPIDHMLYWGSRLAGDKFIHVIYSFIFVGVSGIIFGDSLQGYLVWSNVPFTMIAVVFSVILNFLIYYLISLAAFWFLEISSFFSALTLIISLLSGEIIPIDVMPDVVEKVLNVLPFSYSVYFPVQVLLGRQALPEIFFRLAVQIVWIGVLVLAGRAVWHIGIGKYESVGG